MATTDQPASGSWDATLWHEVKKGETPWKIAEQCYGDGSLYPKILEANTDDYKAALAGAAPRGPAARAQASPPSVFRRRGSSQSRR